MSIKKFLIACLSVATLFTIATACDGSGSNNSTRLPLASSSSESSSSSPVDSSSTNGETVCSHDWSAWATTTAAKCDVEGEQTRTCSLCSNKETQPIPATGHSYTFTSITDADCDTPETQKKGCENCNYSEIITTKPAKGHVGVWTVLESPTCTEAGLKKTNCTRCQTNNVTQVIAPLGHKGLWHVLQMPDCDTAGEKERTCTVCSTYEKTDIPARGHAYDNGFCEECGAGPAFPAGDGDTTLLEPRSGVGTMYNRLECVEGYYEFTIPQARALWMSFSISQPGQYALYSVDGANGCTLSQHNASAQYVTEAGKNCATLSDGTIYSSISCSQKYFNAEWRATFCLKGIKGATVKLRFVRVADPAWEPEIQEEVVLAKDINGVKANDPEPGSLATEVDLNTSYYYDQTSGYYRMGSASNPGEIIYAAITREAPRLLGEGATFISALGTTNPFNLDDGTTEEGNYYVKNYAFFITNYQYDIENGRSYFLTDDDYNYISDPSANCYQNYVNKDGLYPVTQELYAFLNHYTRLHPPVSWENGVTTGEQWLTACFYYANIPEGSSSLNPKTLTVGTHEINVPQTLNYYAQITQAGEYTITCNQDDVVIQILNTNYGEGAGTINATVTITETTQVLIWSESGAAINDVVITVTKNS